MDSGTLTLAIASFLAILFLFGLWATRQSALWLEADTPTYGHALLAIIVAVVVSSFPAFFLRDTQLIASLASLAVTGGVYARILGASFVRGLGIAVISSALIVPVGLSMVLVYGFALGFPMSDLFEMYSKDMNAAVVEQKAEDVCRCGTDEDCLEQRMLILSVIMSKAQANVTAADEKEMIEGASERAFQCVANPQTYLANAPQRPAASVVETPASTEEPASANSIKKKEFRYRDINVGELSKYTNRKIKVQTTRGSTREGYLAEVHVGRMTVGKFRSARGIAYEIPVDEIRHAQVYEEIQ